MKKIILILVVSLVTFTSYASISVPKAKIKLENTPKATTTEFHLSDKNVRDIFVGKENKMITRPRTWYFPTECKVYAVTFDIEGLSSWEEIGLSVMLYIYAQALCQQEKAFNESLISIE